MAPNTMGKPPFVVRADAAFPDAAFGSGTLRHKAFSDSLTPVSHYQNTPESTDCEYRLQLLAFYYLK
jgi:hypothetical protein